MSKLSQHLRQYRPANEWGDGVHHTICDEAARELDRLESERAEQWRQRREAEASRDAAKAVADSFERENARLREALGKIIIIDTQVNEGGHDMPVTWSGECATIAREVVDIPRAELLARVRAKSSLSTHP